jgi:hypothetical protein
MSGVSSSLAEGGMTRKQSGSVVGRQSSVVGGEGETDD